MRFGRVAALSTFLISEPVFGEAPVDPLKSIVDAHMADRPQLVQDLLDDPGARVACERGTKVVAATRYSTVPKEMIPYCSSFTAPGAFTVEHPDGIRWCTFDTASPELRASVTGWVLSMGMESGFPRRTDGPMGPVVSVDPGEDARCKVFTTSGLSVYDGPECPYKGTSVGSTVKVSKPIELASLTAAEMVVVRASTACK